MKFEYLICHHSGIMTKDDQIQQIINGHTANGWDDGDGIMEPEDIGYNFFIEYSGIIIEGRPLTVDGAHTRNDNVEKGIRGPDGKLVNLNRLGIGICLAGDFTKEMPTPAQVRSLHDLTIVLQWQFGIPDCNVLLHYDIKGTLCPGIDLRKSIKDYHIEYLRMRVEQAKKALKWASGSRRGTLIRFIERVSRLIS